MKNKFPLYFLSMLFLGGIIGVLMEIYGEPIPSFLVGVGFAWPISTLLSFIILKKTSTLKASILNKIANAVLLLITAVWLPFALVPPEGRFIFNPEIDTKFSEGYTETKFKQISYGMTKSDVISILAEPISKILIDYRTDYNEVWLYTSDGACSWSDFAWKRKQVHFKNNLVFETHTGWSYD